MIVVTGVPGWATEVPKIAVQGVPDIGDELPPERLIQAHLMVDALVGSGVTGVLAELLR